MNKKMLRVIGVALLINVASAQADNFKIKQMLSTLGIFTIALRYYTKESLSASALANLPSIADEKSLLNLLYRIIDEYIIGQKGKQTDLIAIDSTTGFIVKEKFPATGVLGRSCEIIQKNILPIICAGINLEMSRRALLNGISWYDSGFDGYFLSKKVTTPV